MRTPLLVAVVLASAGCQPSVEERAAAAKGVIDGYCTDCHNDAERTGDLTLERLALTDVGTHAEAWEAVVRKLRGRMMPPAGEPLPEAAATNELVAYLEEQLDLAAAANPNPGHKSLHRLNRTEYGNAIRDLLALDIDASAYLPNDSEAYGFDNIADVLGTDPSLMDRYLSAAWKITSAAMGDTDIAPAVTTYRVPPDRSQRDHVEGLPFGTRGGMLVSHYFPVDGEYVVRPRLWRNTVDVVRGTETPHDLEVSLDGAQLSLTRFGGPADEVPAQMFPGKTADEIDRRFETRVVVTAGQHDVGVTFAKKSSAARQDVLQAFQREKHDARMDVGIPELDQLVIEGPLTIVGPGRSASRERIFSCEPAQESEAAACAEQILTSLARRAYRRPITDDERGRLVDLYGAQRAQGRDFEAGVQTALAYILVSPQFLFRVEQDPPGAAPSTLYRISGLELASRLSFFLWGSLPDDELIDAAVAGELGAPSGLARQVERMLADERATALAQSFAGQWLYLRNLRAAAPDMYVFPDFDDNLRQSAIRETELLFETIVRENRPLTELLTADYTFMNERLAKHYGVPGVYGDQFRRVALTRRAPLRPARARERADAVVVSEPHLAREPRQLRADEHPRHPAARAAPRRADVAREHGREALDARPHGTPPRRSRLRELPPAHGPDRPRPRELRRHRPLAHRGQRRGRRRLRQPDPRPARLRPDQRPRRLAQRHRQPARAVRPHCDREAHDLRPGQAADGRRHADGTRDRPPRGRGRLPVLVSRARARDERRVPNADCRH